MTIVHAKFTKDPDAILDYGIDWSAWLTGGEVITSSSWDIPTGITNALDTFTDTTATIWLTGGTADTDYDLVNEITTDGGRTDNRTIRISVRER